MTLAGITMHPTGHWTTQSARNLFITTTDTFNDCKMLVRDGAGQFTASFDEIFRSERIKVPRRHHGHRSRIVISNDGSARYFASFLTGRSSGTRPSYDVWSTSTSRIITSTGPTAPLASNHHNQPSFYRSTQGRQSSQPPDATDSFTNTDKWPDRARQGF